MTLWALGAVKVGTADRGLLRVNIDTITRKRRPASRSESALIQYSMSKRYLSPAPLPPPKRLHISSHSPPVHSTPRRPLSFDDSLYDELILCIFSHLSWVDLCAAQSTSKNWCRLAADNELWRNLYLSAFARPRLRGARGFHARSDGREVRPLPGRVASSDTLKDWKWMFRISSNWRKGTS